MAKQERHNKAYARFGFARRKTIKQQNIDRIKIPSSWATFDNCSSDAPLDLQDPKTVTNPDDWREVKCPAKIELMLTLRNQTHFGKLKALCLQQKPLRSHFDWSASPYQAELVFEGNYSNRDIDHISQTLLDSFTRVTNLDKLPAKITKEDLSGKFRKWCESTSTSPSSRHLGYYKLLFTTIDHTLPESD